MATNPSSKHHTTINFDFDVFFYFQTRKPRINMSAAANNYFRGLMELEKGENDKESDLRKAKERADELRLELQDIQSHILLLQNSIDQEKVEKKAADLKAAVEKANFLKRNEDFLK